MSSISFFEYEKKHNVLLNKILENENKDIISFIKQNEATVLAPQTVTLENIDISRDFVEAHIIISNPNNDKQWITMSGIFGLFDDKRETVRVLNSNQQLQPFDPLVPPSTLFSSSLFENLLKSSEAQSMQNSIVVLREGHFTVDKSLIPLILISEPVMHPKPAQDLVPKSISPKKTATLTSIQPANSSSPNAYQTLELLKSSSLLSLKPQGLRDMLFQFSLNGAYAPLFPESPESTSKVTPQTSEDNKNQVIQNQNAINASLPRPIVPFLQKLKQPQAADIVRSLKNFLNNFVSTSPRPLQIQGKIVRDFLHELYFKIIEHPLWKDSDEDEQDQIQEGLEKYVMNRLHDSTFGYHCQDKENEALERRFSSLQFITPANLDIKTFKNESSYELAKAELNKINEYKTPKDKLVCILNACKVIYNLLNKQTDKKGPSGADEFLPMAIYVVLKANPKYLYTNVQYIANFRDASKMTTESGYYFTHIVSTVEFLKTVDASSLSNINQREFKNNLELEEERIEAVKSYKFYKMTPEEVTPADIPQMLKEYKELVDLTIKLKAQLKQHSSTTTTSVRTANLIQL